jgi:hypothetical protein
MADFEDIHMVNGGGALNPWIAESCSSSLCAHEDLRPHTRMDGPTNSCHAAPMHVSNGRAVRRSRRGRVDATSNLAAQDRMKRIATDPRLIVPGHDPAIFQRFRGGGSGVVRIE